MTDRSRFILLKMVKAGNTGTSMYSFFGPIDGGDNEELSAKTPEYKTVFVVESNASGIHKAISEDPTANYKLFAVQEIPLRVSHRIKADGVDIRDFQKGETAV